MFEKFGCPSVGICNSALASIFAAGETTGVVLESGAEVTYVVPIHQGHVLESVHERRDDDDDDDSACAHQAREFKYASHARKLTTTAAIVRLSYGGNTITEHLQKSILSRKNGQYFDKDTILHLKKEVCFLKENGPSSCKIEGSSDQQSEGALAGAAAIRSDNFDTTSSDSVSISPPVISQHVRPEHSDVVDYQYQLPDGKTITIGRERFTCPDDVLFKPQSIGLISSMGIHQAIRKSISLCHEDVQPEILVKVILSGGNTLLIGLPTRLENELTADYDLAALQSKNGCPVKVFADKNRKLFPWIGASIFGSFSGFEDQFISKQDYIERGPSLFT